MEQTVNLFNKGLQMDTNPMVQGSDTLSDALNATFVTMNGNEVILQNDMGNRRVDNAYLPPGYEPVGIKEYGGIIYIASYNPITNKSLIGSFPSPLKKIDSLDYGNLKGIFDFTLFTSPNNIERDEYLGVDVLKSDTFMVPLSSDTSLRAGDKFAIYALGLHTMEPRLTNYNNTCYVWKEFNDTIVLTTDYETYFQNDDYHKIEDNKYKFARWKECEESEYNQAIASDRKEENNKYYIKEWTEISSNIEGKAYSPKNRMYTLLAGVLNSQNEFVDITKTLCRWELQNNTWIPKTYESEESEIFKFNDGYFISDTFSDLLRRNSLKDSQLIKKRQQMAANTYSYKLVGPLYLKATYNHVESFNYNIYGTYGGGESAILYVEGYLTYNCPDYSEKLNNSQLNSNEDYGIFDERIQTITDYPGFDLIDTNGIPLRSSSTEPGDSDYDPNYPIITKSIYNPSTNLYSNKIVKKYIVNVVNGNPIFNYTLGVYAGNSTFGNVFIKGLSTKGSLDLSLLGSGKAKLNGWRFYNDLSKQTTTLTFSFNAYPEYGKHFGNLVFNFKDITRKSEEGYEEGYSGINYPNNESSLPLYNGQQTYIIDWKYALFEPNKVYEVTITYDIIDDNNSSNKTHVSLLEVNGSNRSIERWLITTELFNEFYFISKGVSDFCNLENVDESIQTEFKNKMIIPIITKENITNLSKTQDPVYTGGMVSSDKNIEYFCKNSYKVNIISNPKFEIKNKNLYPDFIKINSNVERALEINNYKIERIGSKFFQDSEQNNYNSIFKSIIETINGSAYSQSGSPNEKFNNSTMLNIKLNNSNNKLEGIIEYYDKYFGYNDSGISNAKNVFNLVENLIVNAGPKDGYYGCVLPHFFSRNGHRDEHMIDAYNKQMSSYYFVDKVNNNNIDYGLKFNRVSDEWDIFDNGFRVYSDNSDSTQCIPFNTIKSKVFGHWNSGLYSGQMFMFMYPTDSVWYNNTEGWDPDNLRGQSLARVWWRTSDGEWAQFKTMIKPNQKFSEYIKNQFSKKYVYCMYDSSDLNNVYATNDNYIYNDKYNIPLVLNITYSSNVLNDTLLNGETNIGIGNLTFLANISNIGSSSILFNLNSSEKFLDTVKYFDIDSISNVDMVTGLSVDSKKRKLNRNYIYYILDLDSENKQLVRVDDSYMLVDFENKIDGKNTITYNKYTIGVPDYRCDHSGDDGDDHTIIDYNSTNVVSGI